MKRGDIESLRDRVIEALFAIAPQLLQDDFTLEGVLRLVVVEVRAAVAEDRAGRHRRGTDDVANVN